MSPSYQRAGSTRGLRSFVAFSPDRERVGGVPGNAAAPLQTFDVFAFPALQAALQERRVRAR